MSPVPHYVINALLFALFIVRYVWGPPSDLLRLGLVCTMALGVIINLNFYYEGPFSFLPIFADSPAGFSGKLVVFIFLVADLVKDFFAWRHDARMREFVNYVKGSRRE